MLQGATTAVPAPSGAYILEEDNSLRVFSVAAPSVVGILDSELKNGEEVPEGVGSGVVWTKKGHIVTNYHCIAKLAKDNTGRQVG